jgi:hypothetical protein
MADLLVATLQDAVRYALHGWQHNGGHSSGSTTGGANNSSGTSGGSVSDMMGSGVPIPAPMFPGNYVSKDPVCLLGVRSGALQCIDVQAVKQGGTEQLPVADAVHGRGGCQLLFSPPARRCT